MRCEKAKENRNDDALPEATQQPVLDMVRRVLVEGKKSCVDALADTIRQPVFDVSVEIKANKRQR